MSHTPASRQERGAATRAALLGAGRELFSSRGYAGTPREDIVAHAGVTRGALQHHFGDKEGLFLAVYEAVEAELVGAVARAGMAAGDDPLEQLRAGCRAYLDAVLNPSVQRICAIDGPAVLAADVRQEVTNRYALGLVREAIAAAIEGGEIDDTPVEPLAHVLLAGVTAAAQFVATSSHPRRARAEAGRTVDLILDGLARP